MLVFAHDTEHQVRLIIQTTEQSCGALEESLQPKPTNRFIAITLTLELENEPKTSCYFATLLFQEEILVSR